MHLIDKHIFLVKLMRSDVSLVIIKRSASMKNFTFYKLSGCLVIVKKHIQKNFF